MKASNTGECDGCGAPLAFGKVVTVVTLPEWLSASARTLHVFHPRCWEEFDAEVRRVFAAKWIDTRER